MKLKSRISATVFMIILGTFFFTLFYLVKYFTGSKSFGNSVSTSNLRADIAHRNQASSIPLDGASLFIETPAISNAEILEFLTGKFDKKPLRRRRRKQQKKVFNETSTDSNRALEKQDDSSFNQTLDGEEIARLAKKGRRFRQSDPNVKVRYLRECRGVSKVYLYDEHRTKFPDLVSISRKMENLNPKRTRITLKEVGDLELGKRLFLKKFNGRISNLDMYEENDTTIDVLLNSMATMSITHVTQKSGGTQLKLLVTFQDESQAVLKPMR